MNSHWIAEQIEVVPKYPNGRCEDGAKLLRFGRFCVVPGARQLLADGRSVRLGGRAFDLLLVLLRARGRLVPKDEILRSVWPSLVVEEANVRFQVTALRRALGEDRDLIKTVSGRGYLLTAELMEEPIDTDVVVRLATRRPPPGGTSDLRPAIRHRQSGSRVPLQSDTTLTVAVIDDDPDVREALQGLFRSTGLRTILFSSVQEFLAWVPKSPPQCLVLDVWLPEQNGLDIHSELAKIDMRLPVIFIGGHVDVPMAVRAMKAGAVDFLTKPVHHLDLLNAIRRAIRIASGV
ncbi:response regulator [Mesorhizobium sp. VK22B]|uniref:Response regulator n=1 Tax=Mesorhizobium captivum TaxID=3072319 RepID=A0ABU4Z783_9HYPH|nr:response regulator [Mesorhizobium sp. VK22B]MDX8494751.1 response regulator [Mesorhizobium sp. VK22B]